MRSNGVVLTKAKPTSCSSLSATKMTLCGEVIYSSNCLLADVTLGSYSPVCKTYTEIRRIFSLTLK